MRRSKQEIEEAARRFAELVDRIDPAAVDLLRIDDLRGVAVVCGMRSTFHRRARCRACPIFSGRALVSGGHKVVR